MPNALAPNRNALSQGNALAEVRAWEPGIMDNVRNYAMNALAPLFGGDVRAANAYYRDKVQPTAEFLPGVGDLMAAGEAKDAFGRGEYGMGTLLAAGAAAGLVPGVGDAVQKGVQKATKKLGGDVRSGVLEQGPRQELSTVQLDPSVDSYAVLVKDGQKKYVPDGSPEYFDLVEGQGWGIDDIIERPASFATWADGSVITRRDIESRPSAVKVQEDFTTLFQEAERLGLEPFELAAQSGGARYLEITTPNGPAKIRVSDHLKTSKQHDLPAFNIAPGGDRLDAVIAALSQIKDRR